MTAVLKELGVRTISIRSSTTLSHTAETECGRIPEGAEVERTRRAQAITPKTNSRSLDIKQSPAGRDGVEGLSAR
jgi:hypothetical protein